MAAGSPLFHSGRYAAVEERVKAFLNSHDDFLTLSTAESPRAVGDAVTEVLAASFASILGPECRDCDTKFARRAMADIAFADGEGRYYVVDVKTHRLDTRFNMPNLTSVDRLARFYEDDSNYFVILIVSYRVDRARLSVSNVRFVPIEFLDWGCLTVGALGWGQIQIADSNCIQVRPQYPRRKWMLEFCHVMLEFYPKEILKARKRLARFERLREDWLAKPDEAQPGP